MNTIICGICWALLPIAAAGQTYTVQELPPLPGYARSIAWGVNSQGVAAGFSRNSTSDNRATMWIGGVAVDLGLVQGWSGTAIWDMNEGGVVCGSAGNNLGEDYPQDGNGVVWDGTFTVLPGLSGAYWGGFAVNLSGMVVGFAENAGGYTVPVYWTAAGITPMELLPGDDSGVAWNVNDVPEVVGQSYVSSVGLRSAWYWHPVSGLYELNNGGYTDVVAFGISNSGAIVGNAYDGVNYRGMVWLTRESAPIVVEGPVGYPNLALYNVNDAGVAVGPSYDASWSSAVAVRWTQGGGIEELNDLIAPGTGWNLTDANSIAENGMIVGVGTLNGARRAFLLTPQGQPDEVYHPTAAQVTKGSFLGGTLQSLAADDDDYWRQAAAYDPTDPLAVINSTLRADTSVNSAAYSAGQMAVREKCNTANAKYRVRAVRAAGGFATLADGIQTGFSETLVAAGFPNPISDFIDAANGNRMRLEIRAASANKLAGFFQHSVDLVEWTLTP